MSGTAPLDERSIPSGYKIIRTLGIGAMGRVFLAEKAGIQYAMKILTKHGGDTVDNFKRTQRFSREAEVLLTVQHPNIVKIYEYNISAEGGVKPSYLIMEYVAGGNLSGVIEDGAWTMKEKISALRQIAAALAAIHKHGIFHRDIKPENILIGDGGLIKVSDFGIVKVQNSSLTMTTESMGSPSYMSPESLDSSKGVDGRSDIFSLGVLAYELFTGRKPFEGEGMFELMMKINKHQPEEPSRIVREIPGRLNDAIMKMIEKNPKDRFQTANGVLAAIDGVV
jgi:serine/threonine-protein kinase